MTQPKRKLILVGAIVGAAVVAGALVRPAGLSLPAWRMLMVALAAALLWMTEAVPLGITSLMIILSVAMLDILPLGAGLALVFHPVSAVVFAGFCLATALQKYGLDRRLSLALLLRMGQRTDRAVLGMMLATCLLSTMISNTAATAVMMVIALGVLRTAGVVPGQSNLGRAMLIGIPYAASIGGMGTPAGTPGNVITIALLRDMAGVSMSFLGWTLLALPVLVLALPAAWRLLISMYPPEVGRLDLTECRGALAEMGRFGPEERRVAAIFGLTILLWAAEPFFRAPADWTSLVGLLAVILLSLPRAGVLEWKDIHEHTGWNIFLLIGGGLAMGNGLVRTGAVAWLARLLTSLVAAWPGWLVLSLISVATALAIMVFCTISGTATTMVPLAVGLALAAAWEPRTFAMVAGLSSSFAFLLPANAAPNALAYSSGYFRSGEMLRAGIVLMGTCVLIISLVANLVWPLLGAGI